MTHKDYQVIANAIAKARKELTPTELAVADLVTSYVSGELALHNPNFDQLTFRKAANYRRRNEQ